MPLVCHKDPAPLCLATSTVQITVMESKKVHGRSRVSAARRPVLPFVRRHPGATAAITGAPVWYTYRMHAVSRRFHGRKGNLKSFTTNTGDLCNLYAPGKSADVACASPKLDGDMSTFAFECAQGVDFPWRFVLVGSLCVGAHVICVLRLLQENRITFFACLICVILSSCAEYHGSLRT